MGLPKFVHQTSSKYHVLNMEIEDSRNFVSLIKGTDSPFVSPKNDSEKKPVLMSKFVQIQVKQEKKAVVIPLHQEEVRSVEHIGAF